MTVTVEAKQEASEDPELPLELSDELSEELSLEEEPLEELSLLEDEASLEAPLELVEEEELDPVATAPTSDTVKVLVRVRVL